MPLLFWLSVASVLIDFLETAIVNRLVAACEVASRSKEVRRQGSQGGLTQQRR